MKNLIFIFVLCCLSGTMAFAQQIDYNMQGKYVADGYDVVAYFGDTAVKGSNKFTHTHDGVNYRFANADNLNKFKENPTQYMPQYGGWCAYAMGAYGDKVEINPKTFEIRDGKLYLFYNAYFTNTLDKWLDEGAEGLKTKADKTWEGKKFK
ncbi:MAG: YHS domain-containing (seleno)protein [Chitinophagales bacterium]